MRLTGFYLSAEDRSGSFKDETGSERAYAFTVVTVLDGDAVIRVKVKAAGPALPHLTRGDEVDWNVEVSANAGARGAYLTTTYLGEYTALSALSSF